MSRIQLVESDYWRNRDGSIVHTNDCIHSGSNGARPWRYAQGWSATVVRVEVDVIPWLSLCKTCWKDNADE